jgi:hypothetical protein
MPEPTPPSKSTVMDLSIQPQRVAEEWIYPRKPVFVILGISSPRESVDFTDGHVVSNETHRAGEEIVPAFMVWHNKPINLSENQRERLYFLNEPCVLSHLEMGYLCDDPQKVFHWFSGKISMETAKEIADLLSVILTRSLNHL